MRFRITDSVGNQYVLETDKSHGQLLIEFPPTTDILPIYPPAVEVAIAAVETAVAKKPRVKKADAE